MKSHDNYQFGPHGQPQTSDADNRTLPETPTHSSAKERSAEIGVGRNHTDREQVEVIRPLWSTNNALALEGWDHSLRRAVIVRKLEPRAGQNEVISADFWRQARNQARLRHDRILPVLFIDRLSGWVVTEFCEKRVQDEIGQSRMPSDVLRRILTQALEGLEYLHGKNQVHGGIHPGVILLASDGSVKLDFPSGLEAGAELTLQSGLEKYASPESLDESKFGSVGPKSDIYALGITALELLSGKKFTEFFRGYGLDFSDNNDSWLRWKLSADATIPAVNTILPKADPILASVIERMLEKQVSGRPSAAEAISALAGNSPVGRSLQLAVKPQHASAIAGASLRSVEPIAIAAHPRPADIYTVGSGNNTKKGMKAWAETVVAEGNSNYLAAAMILLAALVAGISLVGGSTGKSEIATTNTLEDRVGPDSARLKSGIDDDGPSEPVSPPIPPKPPEPRTAGPTIVVQPQSGPIKPDPPKVAIPEGRLFISVKPEGAWIKLNGKARQSELEFPLAAGHYTVQVGKWDCLPQEETVDIQPGQPAYVSIGLKPRPTTPAYEPVLCVPDDGERKADDLVAHVLNQLWIGATRTDSLIAVERQLQNGQPLSDDPRVLHAVAIATLGQKNNARRAMGWYERAAQNAPVCYSWPYKGLVKCVLAQGNIDDAVRYSDDFAYRAQELVAKYPDNPKAKLFLADTACFVGRVIGFAEAVSKTQDGRSLISRDLESQLPPDEVAVFRNAKCETLARYKETSGDKDSDLKEFVWQFLGDSVAKERLTLLESISNHSQVGIRVKMLGDFHGPLTGGPLINNHRETLFDKHPNLLVTQSKFGN